MSPPRHRRSTATEGGDEMIPLQSAGGMLWAAGLTWDSLPELCRVHTRTVQRWRASGQLPAALLLFLSCFQNLGVLCDAWDGWMINHRDGLLYSPENEGFAPGELRALFWYRQQIRGMRGQIRQLQRDLQARPPLRDQRWKPARSTRRRSSSAPAPVPAVRG